PFLPRSTGTIVSMAWWFLATTGPWMSPAITPWTWPKLRASAAALARSAGVTPDGREYTTTPGKMLGDCTLAWRLTTLVDSALAGSHADESFFSAPVSLPASGPATTT